MQAKRVMTPNNSGLENGHIFLRDQHAVKRWTSNPADRDDMRDQKFNINNLRIHYVERLIEHRYKGPVDCDGDAHAYVSVVFNAIAMQRRLKRWKQSTSPMIAWAMDWCPVADPKVISDLAVRVVARPRKMTAATAGRLLNLKFVEWIDLSIKTIDPTDVPAEVVTKAKADMKREADLSNKEAARRAEGARALADIQAGSLRAFCERNGLKERTLRLNRKKGPEYVAKYLKRHRVSEKLPQDFATLDMSIYSNTAKQGGNISTRAGGGRLASQPAHIGLILDLNLTDDEFDRLLDQAEQDRRRAADRAAASSVTFRTHIFERIARQVAADKRAA